MRAPALLLLAAACSPMPSSGNPFAPARPQVAPGAPTGVAPSGPQGDGTAFEDDRPEDEEAAPDEGADAGPADPRDKLAAQLRFLRDRPEAPAAPASPGPGAPAGPAPGALPVAAVAALPPPPAPVWDPTRTLPEASFGVRVLGVLLDLQPPRAVLGLPDGREQVVTPGAMLPAEGLVVLAIGRDAVQIARVTPAGFYARVDTEVVPSLFPAGARTP